MKSKEFLLSIQEKCLILFYTLSIEKKRENVGKIMFKKKETNK
jgi:hypothetical protein